MHHKYIEKEGNFIAMAEDVSFHLVINVCNCFCSMRYGLSPLFAKAFGADKFPLEAKEFQGSINKLGMIDSKRIKVKHNHLHVINAYTQYGTSGANLLDMTALQLCLRKINKKFPRSIIGIPKIEDDRWDEIKELFRLELTDCQVIAVTPIPVITELTSDEE